MTACTYYTQQEDIILLYIGYHGVIFHGRQPDISARLGTMSKDLLLELEAQEGVGVHWVAVKEPKLGHPNSGDIVNDRVSLLL